MISPTYLSPQKGVSSMFGLALLCGLQRQQLSFDFVIPSHSPDHFLQGASDDGGKSQPSSLLNFADVLNVPPVQSDAHSLSDSIHLGSEVSSCGPSPQKASERYQNDVESVSRIGQTSHQGAKENPALSARVNHVTPLEPKALPPAVLDELARKHATFTARVMARLSEFERQEINTHLRQDYRQAWITLSLAMKEEPNPFVAASYAIYGIHPDKVFPAWLAEQKARLGKEFYDFYNDEGILRPNLPKFSLPPEREAEANERIEALISAPTLPPSKGAVGAGSGTSGPAPISERKAV